MKDSSSSELVELTRHLNEQEAHLLVSILHDHDIPAVVFDGGVDRLGLEMQIMAGGSKVRVPIARLEEARSLLHQVFPALKESEKKQTAPTPKALACKFCQSENISVEPSPRVVHLTILALISIGIFGFLLGLKSQFQLGWTFGAAGMAILFFVTFRKPFYSQIQCHNPNCRAKYLVRISK